MGVTPLPDRCAAAVLFVTARVAPVLAVVTKDVTLKAKMVVINVERVVTVGIFVTIVRTFMVDHVDLAIAKVASHSHLIPLF
jgi:hypothetical protein